MRFTVPIKSRIGGDVIGSFTGDISVFERYADRLLDFDLTYVKHDEGTITPVELSLCARMPHLPSPDRIDKERVHEAIEKVFMEKYSDVSILPSKAEELKKELGL